MEHLLFSSIFSIDFMGEIGVARFLGGLLVNGESKHEFLILLISINLLEFSEASAGSDVGGGLLS